MTVWSTWASASTPSDRRLGAWTTTKSASAETTAGEMSETVAPCRREEYQPGGAVAEKSTADAQHKLQPARADSRVYAGSRDVADGIIDAKSTVAPNASFSELRCQSEIRDRVRAADARR